VIAAAMALIPALNDHGIESKRIAEMQIKFSQRM
jgi:hypothetical protein